MKKITTSLMLLALSGSSLRAEAFRKVQKEISERAGVDVRWEKEMASREETSAIVQKLLKKPLTVSSAVQIALLNNRGLQVTFEEVGIAQADVIEAVTLPNPSVDFEVQLPLVAGTLNRYAWLVAQEFVQILMKLLQMQASYSQGRLDIAKAETDLRDKREELTRLLGLWGAQTAWQIHGDIMPIPDTELSTKGLESLAIAQRLDLRAAHRDLTSIVTALGLTRIYRWVPVLEFGFAGERDTEGALNMGPSFRLEVPIFNQGKSRLARATAELRRAENRLAGLAVEFVLKRESCATGSTSLRDMASFIMTMCCLPASKS